MEVGIKSWVGQVNWDERWGTERARLFGQAAFFGLAYACQGIGGVFLTGSIGLIFGAFYLILKRNLWPFILAHGTIDTVSVIQLYPGNPVT